MSKKDAVSEFLGDVQEETPIEVFEDKPEAPSSEESVEQTKEETPEPTEEVPFHKNPKLQRFIEREINRRLKEQEPTKPQGPPLASTPEIEELKEALTFVVGNDTPEKIMGVEKFHKALMGLKERTRTETLEEVRAEQQVIANQEKEARNRLMTGLEGIEDSFGVDLTSETPQAQKLQKDFIGFVRRVAPKDGDGRVLSYPDFTETFKVFQETKKVISSPQTQKAKELAARSTGKTKSEAGEEKPQDYSWDSVERILSKFSD